MNKSPYSTVLSHTHTKQATDDSEAFDPSVRGSLGTRARSQGHEDWVTRSEWRWMAESQESSDISHLINEVLSRPGWRAGNALTLMLQQRTRVTGNSLPLASCNMMSADYSLKLAPKLRLQLANFTTSRALVSDSVSSCSLKVMVSTASNTSTPKKCDMAKVRMTARASSSDVPMRPSQQADIGNGNVDPNLYRRVLHKKGNTLSFQEARITCASIGARLCRKSEEILVPNAGGTLEPFFGVQTAVDGLAIHVPYENLRHGERAESAHHNNWLRVSGKEFSELSYPGWMWADNNASRLENEKRTNLIPCCGFVGYPAYMAVDEDRNTYWHSGVTEAANLTISVASSAINSLESIDILWSADFAREYRILMSRDEINWFQVAQNYFGDGSLDSLRLVQSCPTPLLQSFALCSPGLFSCDCSKRCNDLNDCSGHGRCQGLSGACLCDAGWAGGFCNISASISNPEQLHLRIEMRRRALGSDGYGIIDISLRGCSDLVQTSFAVSSLIFTARSDLTPQVSSVVPERGTTAGGSDVTITGNFFSSSQADISVTLGPFSCPVKSITSLSANEQQIVCVSTASGILHGGRKFVKVSVDGHGATAPKDTATFWYIDGWSARTTWGGKAPPTGCGSWADDKSCTDTVYIPEGQVVLLDQSLPRFYMILIQGSLIFDRTDITLSANYILLRGGTLQIGTEQEPFTQQVQITLYGHPKSMELPTFGSKVIACYECKMDIHGTPQVAWTELAATVMPGATEITLQEAVAWPINSKIVIATTDFESPKSSHSEVATVAAILDGGKRVQLKDIRVCPEYGFSGLPKKCVESSALSFPHLGEVKTFDGRPIQFRAEVGLLSRNIVIQGGYLSVCLSIYLLVYLSIYLYIYMYVCMYPKNWSILGQIHSSCLLFSKPCTHTFLAHR